MTWASAPNKCEERQRREARTSTAQSAQELFSLIRCLSLYAALGRGTRKYLVEEIEAVFGQNWGNLPKNMPIEPPQPALKEPPWRRRPGRFRFSFTSLLVRGGRAFYNPRNTAASAVVSFTRVTSTQPPKKNRWVFSERVLEY